MGTECDAQQPRWTGADVARLDVTKAETIIEEELREKNASISEAYDDVHLACFVHADCFGSNLLQGRGRGGRGGGGEGEAETCVPIRIVSPRKAQPSRRERAVVF